MSSINIVVIVGNLTRDPELRALPSGTNVCSLRVAVNDRVKDHATGEWQDRPGYFDVDAFGGQAEACAKYLTRGRQVAVEGRLRWREWETQDGQKRQAVSIAADTVQFIGKAESGTTMEQARGMAVAAGLVQDAPATEPDDDDIPF